VVHAIAPEEHQVGTRSWFTVTRPIGKVMELKANGLTAKGRLRHPRFLRMRPDKNPEDCPIPSTE
jgi:ATP-dependent DNA ligase